MLQWKSTSAAERHFKIWNLFCVMHSLKKVGWIQNLICWSSLFSQPVLSVCWIPNRRIVWGWGSAVALHFFFPFKPMQSASQLEIRHCAWHFLNVRCRSRMFPLNCWFCLCTFLVPYYDPWTLITIQKYLIPNSQARSEQWRTRPLTSESLFG